MSFTPGRLIQLWHELKRRKVIRDLTAYGATSYIIIEVVNNVINPLHLPEWVATVVVLLVLAGLPIVTVLSWIFDITPKGFAKTGSLEVSKDKLTVTKTTIKWYRASNLIITFLLIMVLLFAYPKIFRQNSFRSLRSHDGKISVAIMPFQNMTNDTSLNVWREGIQNELITFLTNFEELRVNQTESFVEYINSKSSASYASITPSLARSISKKLDANVFVCGSIKLADKTIRINAQLINTKTDELFKSFQISGTPGNILEVIDTLSLMVKNFLIITNLKQEASPSDKNFVSTNSPEACKFYYYGEKAFNERDYQTAANMYSQAVKIDTNFTAAIIHLSMSYYNVLMDDSAKKWCLKAYEKKDQMPMLQKAYTDKLYASNFGTPNEVISYSKLILKVDDQRPSLYSSIGYNYINLDQYEKAIPELEKALKIYDKWHSKSQWVYNFTDLGYAYHKMRQFNKEKKLYRKAEQKFPDDPELIYRQAILALTQRKTYKADKYIDKYRSVLKENLTSEADIATDLANLYTEADNFAKSEEYLKLAIELEPEEPDRWNSLAWLLIDKDLNIEKGLELVDKALDLGSEKYYVMDTKGWGLFKQGKYKEALEILQKGWDLRRQHAIYDHEAFLHLESAKKAVVNHMNK